MSKFNVGDKIIIIGPAYNVGIRHSLLSEAEIICICDDFIYINGDSPLGNWWYKPENIQLKSEYDMQNKTELKRIPFDLARANKGDKVIYRDGRAVRILCTDAPGREPIITVSEGSGIISHSSDGMYLHREVSEFDLFMVPVEKKGWIALFESKDDYNMGEYSTECTHVYDTERLLLDHIKKSWSAFRVKDIKEISWTE
jgi:hypothetical protein